MEDTRSSKKRSIMYSMFLTWKGEFDKEFHLCTEDVNPIVVVLHAAFALNLTVKLKLGVITATHIYGAESLHTTVIRDHTKPDQHVYAMVLHQQKQANSNGLSVTMTPVVDFVFYYWKSLQHTLLEQHLRST